LVLPTANDAPLAVLVQQSPAVPETPTSDLDPDFWDCVDIDDLRLPTDSSCLSDSLQTFTDAEDNLPHSDDAVCLDFIISKGFSKDIQFELRFDGTIDGHSKLELVSQGRNKGTPAEDLWLRRKYGFYEDFNSSVVRQLILESVHSRLQQRKTSNQ
jgi:hypothetical protein